MFNIKSAKKMVADGQPGDHMTIVIRNDDSKLFVPNDPNKENYKGNKDYQELLAWVAEGNTIEEAD